MTKEEREALGRNLRRAREAQRPTVSREDVAAIQGGDSNYARVTSYEIGRVQAPASLLARLGGMWGIPLPWFYSLEELPVPARTPPAEPPAETAKESTASYQKNLKGIPEGKVKIYGAASAGDGSSSRPDFDELDVPLQFARDDYGALIVEGRSMEPLLESGDIAIFRDWREPKPGFVMAITDESGEWLIKLVRGPDRAESLNAEFGPVQGMLGFSGFLVGLVRDKGQERMIRLNPYGLKPDAK